MATTPLTDLELQNARRFAGYAVAAALIYQDAVTQGASNALDVILAALTDDQLVAVRASMVTMTTIESTIAAAVGRLSTDKAAVWTRNRTEISDLEAVFMSTRRRFCADLGIAPGPGIFVGTATMGIVPAVFTV